jgi:hypothetical protein
VHSHAVLRAKKARSASPTRPGAARDLQAPKEWIIASSPRRLKIARAMSPLPDGSPHQARDPTSKTGAPGRRDRYSRLATPAVPRGLRREPGRQATTAPGPPIPGHSAPQWPADPHPLGGRGPSAPREPGLSGDRVGGRVLPRLLTDSRKAAFTTRHNSSDQSPQDAAHSSARARIASNSRSSRSLLTAITPAPPPSVHHPAGHTRSESAFHRTAPLATRPPPTLDDHHTRIRHDTASGLPIGHSHCPHTRACRYWCSARPPAHCRRPSDHSW